MFEFFNSIFLFFSNWFAEIISIISLFLSVYVLRKEFPVLSIQIERVRGELDLKLRKFTNYYIDCYFTSKDSIILDMIPVDSEIFFKKIRSINQLVKIVFKNFIPQKFYFLNSGIISEGQKYNKFLNFNGLYKPIDTPGFFCDYFTYQTYILKGRLGKKYILIEYRLSDQAEKSGGVLLEKKAIDAGLNFDEYEFSRQIVKIHQLTSKFFFLLIIKHYIRLRMLKRESRILGSGRYSVG